MCPNQPKAFDLVTFGLSHSMAPSLHVGVSLPSTTTTASKTSVDFSPVCSIGYPIPHRHSTALPALSPSLRAVLTFERFSPPAAPFSAIALWSWTASHQHWLFAARAGHTAASCVVSSSSGPQRSKTSRVFPSFPHSDSWSCATMPTRNCAESPNHALQACGWT